MKVVCNASPLISLARLERLALLPALFGEVQIAAEVYHEVGHRRRLVPDLRAVYAQMPMVGIRVHPEILNRSLAAFGLPPL